MARISLKSICRVCLSNKEVTLPLSTNVKGSSLTEMINSICTSVNIKIGDKYPQNICIGCFENLKNGWEFKTVCENTQECLLKFNDYPYNDNNKDKVSDFFNGEDITVKIEKTLAGEKKEILDTKTMKNLKDLLSYNSNFEEDLVEKLNDSSAMIARLLGNRQILVKNMNMSNLSCKNEYKPNIIINFEQRFLTEEFPFSNEKCITKTEFSDSEEDSCPIDRNDSDFEDNTVPLEDNKVKININLRKKQERIKRTTKQENNLSKYEKQIKGEGVILNFDPTYLKWKAVPKKKASKVGPYQKETKARKCKPKQKSKDSIESNVCPICGKMFRSNMTRHIEVFHKGTRSFTCKICQKAFKDKAYLKDHENQHTGNKKYLCSLCGLSFVQHSGYRQHLRTHPEISRNKCKICNKAFTTPGVLKDHMNTHNNERKYSCNICHKRFFSQSTLRGHSVSHQERKHKCDVCNKVFHGSHELKRHMLVHTGVKPFQCDICMAKFTQKSDMKKHIMRHFKSADGLNPISDKQTALPTYRMQSDLSYPWPND